ncbi:MAG: hypothetical protein JNJ40_12370 [Bacteroidia bacterium]|nr:hypothetical protein [Bacteroidia bacterium]
MQKHKQKIEYLFAILLFFFGLYYYCFRILGFDLAYTPGDFGDSRFINYVLEHGYRWLCGIEPDFWRANFMYPLKDNIAISDSMAGALPIYALFRFIGIDVEPSYQLWWLSCCILNFWLCFVAFKKIGFKPFLSAIGAYAFAFGINNFNQFVHLQFNCKFFVPIAIALFYSFLKEPKQKYFILLVLAIVLQFYCSAYIAIFLIMFLFFFGVLYLSYSNNRKLFVAYLNKKLLIRLSIVTITGMVLILLVALPYFNMARALGPQKYSTIVSGIPTFFSYFLPVDSSITWQLLRDTPAREYPLWYLHELFAGIFCYMGFFIALIHVIYCVIKKQTINFLSAFLVVSCCFFILLFSRTESGHSLFKYIQMLPGFGSMRLTSRFMIVITFVMIWLSLYYFSKFSKERSIWLSLFLAFLVIGDNLFDNKKMSRSLTQERINKTERMCNLIRSQNTANNKIIAVLNLKDGSESFHLDVMLATQKLGLYTLNGYSSTCYGNLCAAYNDPNHIKLSNWLKSYYIEESKVTFIND